MRCAKSSESSSPMYRQKAKQKLIQISIHIIVYHVKNEVIKIIPVVIYSCCTFNNPFELQ